MEDERQHCQGQVEGEQQARLAEDCNQGAPEAAQGGAVVVPGTLPSADGRYGLYCAVIVKRVDEKTRAKVGINELLRAAR